MHYTPFTKHVLELHPSGKIEQMLLAIARASYAQASPRGLGYDAAYQHEIERMRPVTKMGPEEVDFNAYITRDFLRRPEMLLMDYINGRDCRTKVYKQAGKWLFDKYAFEQREVTAEEFVRGVRRVSAEGFLEGIVC